MSEPKRYTGKTEGSTLGSPHWEHPEGEWVKWEDYARLKAECQARQAENSVLAVECDSLKAEVERLKGIILAQSSEFVRNATKQEEEPLPDGWNSSVAKACDLLAEKDKDYARLKAEVERLTLLQVETLDERNRAEADVKALRVELADAQESYHLVNERIAQILKQRAQP